MTQTNMQLRQTGSSPTQFRYLPMETLAAEQTMAYDEACLEAVRDGAAPPTIRLYRWQPSAISIGNYQCLADEVDRAAARAAGVPIVRRLTGGGAVYHDHDGEVTYSFIAPAAALGEHGLSVTKTYQYLCGLLIEALATLGITATFRPINDIAIGTRKVSGNAQTRRSGVILQHGTLLLKVDPERMFQFLTPDARKLGDKPFTASVKAAVTGLHEHGITDRTAVEKALLTVFHKHFPGEVGTWTTREQYRAEELVHTKYTSDAWTALR